MFLVFVFFGVVMVIFGVCSSIFFILFLVLVELKLEFFFVGLKKVRYLNI